jgi:hypothetical protein
MHGTMGHPGMTYNPNVHPPPFYPPQGYQYQGPPQHMVQPGHTHYEPQMPIQHYEHADTMQGAPQGGGPEYQR